MKELSLTTGSLLESIGDSVPADQCAQLVDAICWDTPVYTA